MNGWDVFTWAMVIVLAVGSVGVFAAFLRDLGGLFEGLDRPGGKPVDSAPRSD